MPRRACANGQPCYRLHCTHTQRLDIDEDLDQHLDLLPCLIRKHMDFRGIREYAISAKITCTGPYYPYRIP